MARSYAEAIRSGTMEAARLHARLDTKRLLEVTGGGVDVFGAAREIGLTILFRPLNSLLGAYMREPVPGALVTTLRPMAIQRFTGAHELGHHVLGHDPSLDADGILRRSSMSLTDSGNGFQEAEANAFAAAFVMPKWLIQQMCVMRGWGPNHLRNPLIVYQLSLRLGQSYEALTWTLERYRMIDDRIGRELRETTPKQVKLALLGEYRPESYRADVWLLTDLDRGLAIDGSKNDIFVLRLNENSGAGYLWDAGQLVASGFALLRDTTLATGDAQTVGGHVVREITASTEAAEAGDVIMRQVRPWQPQAPIATFDFRYDVTGPEREGLSRAERKILLEAA